MRYYVVRVRLYMIAVCVSRSLDIATSGDVRDDLPWDLCLYFTVPVLPWYLETVRVLYTLR